MEFYDNYLKSKTVLFNEIVTKLQSLLDYCIRNNKLDRLQFINFKLDTPLDDLYIAVFNYACEFVMSNKQFEKYRLSCGTVETVNVFYGSFAKLTIRIALKDLK